MLLHRALMLSATDTDTQHLLQMVKRFTITMPDGKRKLVPAATANTLLTAAAALEQGGSLWFTVSDGVEEMVTDGSDFDGIPLELYFRQPTGEDAG